MEPLSNIPLSPPAAGGWTKEVSVQSFMKDVVHASTETPVIVYFTAAWCGPCKQLGPAIEKFVNASGGKIHLARVDIDKNKEIAAQFRIQSVPTVYVFVQGQPVDGFSGAIPESQLKQFFGRFIDGGKADASIEQLLVEAKTLAEQGETTAARQLLTSLITQIPDNKEAIALLIKLAIADGEVEEAEALLDSLELELKKDPAITSAITALELAKKGANAGDIDALKKKLAAAPKDHETRLALADALYARGNIEPAMDELFAIMTADREWNEQAARKQLVSYFEALGPTHPLAKQGRRRLSSILFS